MGIFGPLLGLLLRGVVFWPLSVVCMIMELCCSGLALVLEWLYHLTERMMSE